MELSFANGVQEYTVHGVTLLRDISEKLFPSII